MTAADNNPADLPDIAAAKSKHIAAMRDKQGTEVRTLAMPSASKACRSLATSTWSFFRVAHENRTEQNPSTIAGTQKGSAKMQTARKASRRCPANFADENTSNDTVAIPRSARERMTISKKSDDLKLVTYMETPTKRPTAFEQKHSAFPRRQ
jgi:hypothetical protein